MDSRIALAVLVALSSVVAASCGRGAGAVPAAGSAAAGQGAFVLSSPAFENDAAIPARFTCKGADVSPALAWTGVPAGAKSLVLIVDDPDAPDPAAPKTTWVHWVLYNLSPSSTGLPEAVASASLPAGARPGTSDFKRTSWGGPCPPVGVHRYFFKLYALDAMLPDLGAATKADLVRAMEGHVLANTILVGRFGASE